MTSWLDTEFAGQKMGDKRLDKRAKKIVESLSKDPLESIPNATPAWEETLAAFLTIPNVLLKQS